MKAKTYNATNRVSATLRRVIKNTLEIHVRYKSCYTWKADNGNEKTQARYIKVFNKNNPSYWIKTPIGKVWVRPSLELSRKNVYYRLLVMVDGDVKDIRILQKLISKQ